MAAASHLVCLFLVRKVWVGNAGVFRQLGDPRALRALARPVPLFACSWPELCCCAFLPAVAAPRQQASGLLDGAPCGGPKQVGEVGGCDAPARQEYGALCCGAVLWCVGVCLHERACLAECCCLQVRVPALDVLFVCASAL